MSDKPQKIGCYVQKCAVICAVTEDKIPLWEKIMDRRGRVFSLFRLFSFFLLRCNFVSGVDCHAHADQRATSEILVSLHQLLATRVEASCHAGKCSE